MNKVILIGRLTADPELRLTTTSAIPVTRFSLAVDRPKVMAKEGQQNVDFIDCMAWRKLGEIVAEYLHKGSLVAVEGRLQIRPYETQDGQKRRATEIVAENVRFLEPKKSSPTAPEAADLVEADALPF